MYTVVHKRTLVYTGVMNIRDFRKDLSKHLDTALTEPVYIERGGVTFVLVSNIAPKGNTAPTTEPWNEVGTYTIKPQPSVLNIIEIPEDAPRSSNIRPDIKKSVADAQPQKRNCPNGHMVNLSTGACFSRECQYS